MYIHCLRVFLPLCVLLVRQMPLHSLLALLLLAIAAPSAWAASRADAGRLAQQQQQQQQQALQSARWGDAAASGVPAMSYDQAAVRFVAADGALAPPFNVTVWYKSDDCSLDCASLYYAAVDVNGSTPYTILQTAYGYVHPLVVVCRADRSGWGGCVCVWRRSTLTFYSSQWLRGGGGVALGTFHKHFGEFGVYTFVLSGGHAADPTTDFTFALQTDVEPSAHTFTPLINGVLVLFAMALAYFLFLYCYRKHIAREKANAAAAAAGGLHQPLTSAVGDERGAGADAKPTGAVNSESAAGGGSARKPSQSGGAGSAPRKKERLRSLDTFRGLCLSIMIFVNVWHTHPTPPHYCRCCR